MVFIRSGTGLWFRYGPKCQVVPLYRTVYRAVISERFAFQCRPEISGRPVISVQQVLFLVPSILSSAHFNLWLELTSALNDAVNLYMLSILQSIHNYLLIQHVRIARTLTMQKKRLCLSWQLTVAHKSGSLFRHCDGGGIAVSRRKLFLRISVTEWCQLSHERACNTVLIISQSE